MCSNNLNLELLFPEIPSHEDLQSGWVTLIRHYQHFGGFLAGKIGENLADLPNFKVGNSRLALLGYVK